MEGPSIVISMDEVKEITVEDKFWLVLFHKLLFIIMEYSYVWIKEKMFLLLKICLYLNDFVNFLKERCWKPNGKSNNLKP